MKFALIGLAIVWFGPGLVAATVCLLKPELRRRAHALHVLSLDESMLGFHGRKLSEQEMLRRLERWQHSRRQTRSQYLLIFLVLTTMGPIGVARVNDLRKAKFLERPR